MNARLGVRNFSADAHCAQVGQSDNGWSIVVESSATIVELCTLMYRFKCRRAVKLDRDRLALIPDDPSEPCPTGEQIVEVLDRGLGDVPMTLRVQAS